MSDANDTASLGMKPAICDSCIYGPQGSYNCLTGHGGYIRNWCDFGGCELYDPPSDPPVSLEDLEDIDDESL